MAAGNLGVPKPAARSARVRVTPVVQGPERHARQAVAAASKQEGGKGGTNQTKPRSASGVAQIAVWRRSVGGALVHAAVVCSDHAMAEK